MKVSRFSALVVGLNLCVGAFFASPGQAITISDLGIEQIQGRAGQDRFRSVIYNNWGFFGVFDGHGGEEQVYLDSSGAFTVASPEAASFSSNRLFQLVFQELDKRGKGAVPSDILDLLHQSFISLDEEAMLKKLRGGSTATVAFFDLRDPGLLHLYLSNIGDSPAVLYYFEKDSFKSELLTESHTFLSKTERERIESIGFGKSSEFSLGVEKIRNSERDLSVSRSFGDFDFKRISEHKEGRLLSKRKSLLLDLDKSYVTSVPSSRLITLDSKSNGGFLILASDGVIETKESKYKLAFTSEEAASFVLDAFKQGKSAHQAAREMIEFIQKNYKYNDDDKTVIIIRFDEQPPTNGLPQMRLHFY